ncbi:hypothetical protein EJB05_47236, partial [Eragrostis curvula]
MEALMVTEFGKALARSGALSEASAHDDSYGGGVLIRRATEDEGRGCSSKKLKAACADAVPCRSTPPAEKISNR